MRERPGRRVVAILFVAILVVVTVGLLGSWFGNNSKSSAAIPPPKGTVTHVATPKGCWKVVLNSNEGFKVLSNGVPASARATGQTTLSFLLGNAQIDPRALLAMTDAYDQRNNIPQLPADAWHSWVSGNCYNAAGQAQWYQTATNYQLASITIAPAPAVGCNYSVTPNGNPTCQVESITGDRSGIMITFSNGQTLYVMYRCGNPVIPGSPPQASPPTSTPPSTPTPTTPTYGCPPGQHPSPLNGVCIEAKNPAADPLNNPQVPPIVKGPGTTPPNGDPGPPTKPVDTPTGCNGACPGPTTPTTTAPTVTTTTQAPSPTPVSTQPPSSGGSGTVQPPSSS